MSVLIVFHCRFSAEGNVHSIPIPCSMPFVDLLNRLAPEFPEEKNEFSWWNSSAKSFDRQRG